MEGIYKLFSVLKLHEYTCAVEVCGCRHETLTDVLRLCSTTSPLNYCHNLSLLINPLAVLTRGNLKGTEYLLNQPLCVSTNEFSVFLSLVFVVWFGTNHHLNMNKNAMTFVGSFADVARRLSVKCDQTTQTQKQISIRA